MPPIDLADLSARGAAATADAIKSGQTTASAVIDHALAAIAAAEPLGAFVSVLGETARADAAAIDRDIASGRAVGPLAGAPVAVKDIIDVAGLPTRAGSVTRDKLPPAAKDAFAVAKLRAAGALVIAKSKTVEYAFGGWGTNVIAGTPVNPFDKAVHRVPGGSSSGSGVAVGAGLVPLAFGTDTGGSVRLPASWCGCVGYKTSFGLIGRSGVVPLALAFDTIGPMTRTVRDAALMGQAMLGRDPDDEATAGAPSLDLVSGLDRGVAGLTIGVLSLENSIAVDGEIGSAIEAMAQALAKAGARVIKIALPETLTAYTLACGDLMAVEGYYRYGGLADSEPCLIGAPVAKRMRAGKSLSGVAYFGAVERRHAAIKAALAALEGVDALILPTTPAPAIPVAEVDEAGLPGILTRFVNYLAFCGISVPVGLSRQGLPLGLQVVARLNADSLALQVASAIEQAAGGPLALPR